VRTYTIFSFCLCQIYYVTKKQQRNTFEPDIAELLRGRMHIGVALHIMIIVVAPFAQGSIIQHMLAYR
jgi:hypothetical protein